MNGLDEPVAPDAAAADSRLRVDRLEVRLDGGAEIVSEVSFTVEAGRVLGLVGESGSGKTTVSLALLGYARRGLRIVGGVVALDGRDVLNMSSGELAALRGAQVAYVAQDPATALNPVLRVGHQVGEVLRIHHGRGVAGSELTDRVSAVLDDVDLPQTRAFLRRYPHQLSGGQQQRIALAMAFVCRPGLIVLDEPTTGLDVTTQRRVLETVAALAERYQTAAVYVSHDLAVVSRVAQTVAVMRLGRIVEQGPTGSVFTAPSHDYTESLLRAVPSLERGAAPHHGPDGAATPDGPPVAVDPDTRQAADAIGADLLSMSDVSAWYGSNSVLDAVSFNVPRRSCVAVVGESGSGKTTLARCIVGLHTTWSGRLVLDGQPLPRQVLARDRHALQMLQYVFQNPYASLNPRKTIAQLVAQPIEHFFAPPQTELAARVQQALDEVSLPRTFLSRYPDQLSGGERQRVAIARALAAEPTLLVCDEITSALDVSVQAVVIDLLRDLQSRRQLTMLFITHNLALVREIAQHVVVLEGGRVVESGTTTQILEEPRQPYTRRLLRDAPQLAGARAPGR